MTAQNTLLINTRPPRTMQSSFLSLLGWAIILAVLAWSWEGADMRPLGPETASTAGSLKK